VNDERFDELERQFLRADARTREMLRSGQAGRLSFDELAEHFGAMVSLREEMRELKADVAGGAGE
jgi:hypothetical protein